MGIISSCYYVQGDEENFVARDGVVTVEIMLCLCVDDSVLSLARRIIGFIILCNFYSFNFFP